MKLKNICDLDWILLHKVMRQKLHFLVQHFWNYKQTVEISNNVTLNMSTEYMNDFPIVRLNDDPKHFVDLQTHAKHNDGALQKQRNA